MSRHAVSGQKRKAEMKGYLTHVTSRDLDEGRHFRWWGRGQPKKGQGRLRHVLERGLAGVRKDKDAGKKKRLMIVKY